ncbi:hypothetical protein DITRI_Ditri10aG0171500 [Diplodiscus trichospermus]
MKSEVVKLGSSILVPCVQELAKKPSTKIPPRYVRTDEGPVVLSDTNSLPLINHGVSPALMEKVKYPRVFQSPNGREEEILAKTR